MFFGSFIDMKEFMEDLKKGTKNFDTQELEKIETNVDEIVDVNREIQDILESFDEKLYRVLGQHEDDFLYAYKMHMVKIEKELQYLKQKSQE